MAFQVSPGVNVSEIDLTTIVPSVSTSSGAFAGQFQWGPVEEAVLISSEDELVSLYGKPTSDNFETFYTAANFLAYGNQLYISRAAESTLSNTSLNTYNAVGQYGGATTTNSQQIVKNIADFESKATTLEANTTLNWLAKYPGTLGNSLKISVCPTINAYFTDVHLVASSNAVVATANVFSASLFSNLAIAVGSANLTFSFGANTSATYWSNAYTESVANYTRGLYNVGDFILVGNNDTGAQYLKIASIANTNTANTSGLSTIYSYSITFADTFKQKSDYVPNFVNSNTVIQTIAGRYWEYFNLAKAPGRSTYVNNRIANTSIIDELHIIVEDVGGKFTGTPGQILEVWTNLSRVNEAKGEQGGSIYWRDVINNSSEYVWSTKDFLSGANSSLSESMAVPLIVRPSTNTFVAGTQGTTESTISISALATAYDEFASAEDIDISLILGGKARGGSGEQLANYIIDNITDVRRDCVAFITPERGDSVSVPGRELTNTVTFRNLLRSTSYAVLDSGYKYQYDRYNDVYRYVPMNGDIAGLCVRTDNTRDPWYSPAGFNRGNIKNIIKLAYNPDKADRDELYKAGINPVVNFPGQGVILYGDKTLLAKPSAFDRINVRRLFIVLEKAIATAAKTALFEFNDDFTRAAFRNLVEPYLRDIQGRRGIYDFRVVCDTTNNTAEVIDRNEFRGDIYVKPARSINFIQLNFVAVRTGVEFEEIVGRF